MKKLLTLILFSTLCTLHSFAQAWPENYSGVMLQGFYWDSYSDSRWKKLEKEADILKDYFSLVWVPQSGSTGGNQSMGYDDMWWFNDYESSFGNEKELRSMIATFREKGIKTIADVVINHRKNVSTWVDFPVETYKGETYEMFSTDICANDDGGATKTWASKNGFQLSTNNDTGEDWSGMRDLDHNSANVQRVVKAYLDFLLNDLGYAGFRYDMVKGYAGRFTGLYNSTAQPEFSVGEYWDGNVSAVQNWLNATKVDGKIQSAAFDFPFRYNIRDAVNNNDWRKLDNTSTLAHNSNYQRYGITFIENHDTEYRSATSQNDPVRRDTLAANAYLLAMPGTPCVFLKHWIDEKCRTDIAKMVKARRLCGVHNQSTFSVSSSTSTLHVHIATGTNCRLLCAVGKGVSGYTAPDGWYLAAKGYHWAYYTDKKIEIGEIVFPEEPFEPHTITVGVDVSAVGWTKVNFWTWGGDGSHAPASGKWPGDEVGTMVTIDGRTFYTKQYNINSAKDCVNFVFSTGTGSPQTVDIYDVTENAYFAISTTKTGDKNRVDDITDQVTPVIAPKAQGKHGTNAIYSIDGRKKSKRSGLFIEDGKKIVNKL